MKKHVIDISEELKGSRYLCKMKSIVETFFEYDGDHKNSKKKCLFIVLRKQLWYKPNLMYLLMILLIQS